MAWPILMVSGVLEAVWAIALGRSEGLTRPVATVVFLVALAASMIGLGQAMKSIPLGTAYAVWVGIGASIAVAYSFATGQETVSVVKILLLLGLISCIVGLRLAS